MDPEKRKLILKEIEHWRRSKLLPEQYCDFLRNLYLEGESEPDPGWFGRFGVRFGERIAAGWKPKFGWLVPGAIAAILMSSLYFTIFHPLLQTLLSIVLVALLIGIGLRKRRQNLLAGMTALGAGCLLALLLGLVMLRQMGWTDPQATVALVAVCSVIWLAAGLVSGVGLLQVCGYFALLSSYLWLIQSWHPHPGFWLLQLYLLPVSLLLYAAGSWIYGGIGSAGAMLMVAAGLFLVAPEGYGLIVAGMRPALAVPVLAGKLAAAALVIWRRRLPPQESEWTQEFD